MKTPRQNTAPRRRARTKDNLPRMKESGYVVNARPDSLDFRDLMYVPTLVEVPTEIPLGVYQEVGAPILDQGQEGACTGFGLAAAVNFLLRKRAVYPDDTPVSPWMLYRLAQRYDEWPGEAYEGSSARGAMKGWHKHGVCRSTLWKRRRGRLSGEIAADAVERPLGAYFRVDHRNLVAMHCALAEVGILYVTAMVHTGWDRVNRSDGRIPHEQEVLGGHAFVIVAFTQEGFWIQNSWGDDWGKDGYALLSYDDWLANGTDAWVARLGVATRSKAPEGVAKRFETASGRIDALSNLELRAHIISLGNDGRLRDSGEFGTEAKDVDELFGERVPEVTRQWRRKRLLVYAHGGLTSERSAVQRVAEYRKALLANEVYPIAFVWKTDYWSTIKNILRDAVGRRKSEGFLDSAKDFMLDRLDDALEPLARALTGKAAWDEMKENALRGSTLRSGGVRLVAERLAAWLGQENDAEVHLVGHSAGSILLAGLVRLLCSRGRIPQGLLGGSRGLGIPVESCTLWAPACTMDLFEEAYAPALDGGKLKKLALFTLSDEAERDDHCANIYHKSLLYLVSNAFEEKLKIPLLQKGHPILGMQKFAKDNRAIERLVGQRKLDWVLSPNGEPEGSTEASAASHHGDFDDDTPTVLATLARILKRPPRSVDISFSRSPSARSDRRQAL